jgi:hypothetical protein
MQNIQPKLEYIINNLSKEEFIFDFLLAFDYKKASIFRLKS